jgi:hypothetical protein
MLQHDLFQLVAILVGNQSSCGKLVGLLLGRRTWIAMEIHESSLRTMQQKMANLMKEREPEVIVGEMPKAKQDERLVRGEESSRSARGTT